MLALHFKMHDRISVNLVFFSEISRANYSTSTLNLCSWQN